MRTLYFTTYGGRVIDLTPVTLTREVGGVKVTEAPTIIARLLAPGKPSQDAQDRLGRPKVSASERLRTYEPQRVRSWEELKGGW